MIVLESSDVVIAPQRLGRVPFALNSAKLLNEPVLRLPAQPWRRWVKAYQAFPNFPALFLKKRLIYQFVFNRWLKSEAFGRLRSPADGPHPGVPH